VSYLLRKKWISARQDYLRRLGDKTEKIARLLSSPEETMAYAVSRPKSAAMQKSVLELMCSVGSAAVKEICYYTGAKPATVNKLAELGYLELLERPILRCRQIVPAKLNGPLVLNSAQQQVYEGLLDQMREENPGTALTTLQALLRSV
jgi:primosomal protein N' (replication factor Y)